MFTENQWIQKPDLAADQVAQCSIYKGNIEKVFSFMWEFHKATSSKQVLQMKQQLLPVVPTYMLSFSIQKSQQEKEFQQISCIPFFMLFPSSSKEKFHHLWIHCFPRSNIFFKTSNKNHSVIVLRYNTTILFGFCYLSLTPSLPQNVSSISTHVLNSNCFHSAGGLRSQKQPENDHNNDRIARRQPTW